MNLQEGKVIDMHDLHLTTIMSLLSSKQKESIIRLEDNM